MFRPEFLAITRTFSALLALWFVILSKAKDLNRSTLDTIIRLRFSGFLHLSNQEERLIVKLSSPELSSMRAALFAMPITTPGATPCPETSAT